MIIIVIRVYQLFITVLNRDFLVEMIPIIEKFCGLLSMLFAKVQILILQSLTRIPTDIAPATRYMAL